MNAKKITVEYEDGSIKEITKGMCASFEGDNLSMDLVDIAKMDIVRIAYGTVSTVDQMGLTELLAAYMDGEIN